MFVNVTKVGKVDLCQNHSTDAKGMIDVMVLRVSFYLTLLVAGDDDERDLSLPRPAGSR